MICRSRTKAATPGRGFGSGFLAALVLGCTLVIGGCGRGKAEAPQGPPVMPVKVQTVESHEVGDTSEYVATIKSRHSATVMSDVEGWIFDIHVHSGQFVKKGQTLMEIDPRRQQATVSNYDSQRAAKQAALQWAKLQLDRAVALSKSGVVSQQDMQQAQSTYDSALADVKSMDAQITQQQVQLKYYSVFAVTDGQVGDIPVHVGDRVTNTTLLTTIDERSGLEVYLTVPSERAHEVKMGAPVEVLDDAGNVLLRTRIDFISPQIDPSMQALLVKAPADQAADVLRSMQLVRARIAWNTHPGLTIPVVAVSRVSGQFFAFVAEQQEGKSVARQRPLQLGPISGNDYTVVSGLKPGDQVVTSGGQNLSEGAPIRIEQ